MVEAEALGTKHPAREYGAAQIHFWTQSLALIPVALSELYSLDFLYPYIPE